MQHAERTKKASEIIDQFMKEIINGTRIETIGRIVLLVTAETGVSEKFVLKRIETWVKEYPELKVTNNKISNIENKK